MESPDASAVPEPHAVYLPLAGFGLLARLPGIGTRLAERIAFHLLKDEPKEALKLAGASIPPPFPRP